MDTVTDHKARTPKKCDHCGRIIQPGQTYTRVVTFPGESSYPIGGGDYESVDWPFSVTITHDRYGECANYLLPGEPGYNEQLLAIRSEEATALGAW